MSEPGATPTTAQHPPTPQQAEAIDTRDRDLLLAAGAGTGKTRVLAERYVAALEDLHAEGAEKPIDAIVAFTFTERAAAELRERIRRYLEEGALAAAAAGRDDDARRLREWASGLSRAWISTIHGFCRRLLAVHPTRLGLDPRFRVLESAEAGRLAGDAFELALTSFLERGEGDGGAERARLLAVFRVRSLREAILSIHSELRSQGREPDLPEARPSEVGPAIEALQAAARAAAAECADATKGKAKEYLASMARAAELRAGEGPSAGEIAALGFKGGGKAFDNEPCRAYNEAVKAAGRAVIENDSMEAYELLRELLREFARHYRALKAERSGLDFEDLQLEAVRLLGENPDLRDDYRERFRHIMVDEFQDTNLSQMQLIDLLHGDPGAAAAATPANHLFAVGDELQAIYGFRHADIEVFRSLRTRLEALDDSAGRALPLTGNFRSTPGLIAAINQIGRTLLPETYADLDPGAGEESEDEPAVGAVGDAGDADLGPDVELLLVPAKGGKSSLWSERAKDLDLVYGGDNAPGPARVAEARALAARLRDLADGGVPQSEMVVLLRAFTPVAAVEQELRRAGLDPYVVGGRGYWQQQQVDDLRRFLEALANPLDDLGLLGLLASPAGGISPDALWLIRRAAGKGRLWPALEEGVEGLPEADAVRLAEVVPRFTALRERAPSLPLAELIEAVISEFGYDLAVLMRDDGRRRTANIRKLMRMAAEYESAEGRDLRGFLDHLDERADDVSEGEAAVEAEGREVVRIMTVHAAKGLEFRVVAFADTGRGLLLGGFPPVMRVGRRSPVAVEGDQGPAEEAAARVGVRMARWSAPMAPIFQFDELAAEADDDGVEEALRLAHVAVTRAREKLILTGQVSPKALENEEPRPSISVAERLAREWEIPVGGEGNAEEDDGDPGEEIDLDVAAPGSLRVRIARPTKAWSASVERSGTAGEPPEEGELTAPLVRAAPGPPPVLPSRLSYTSISLFEDCGFRFYSEQVLGLPEDKGRPGAGGSSRARARGSAAHVLLEWSARNGWRLPDAERVAAVLRSHDLEASEAEVAATLETIGRWNDSPIRAEIERDCEVIRAESNFALTTASGTVVGGQIDLLGTRNGSGPLVVDYKTNRLDGTTPEALFEAKYSAQRDIYALAAAGGGDHVETAFVFLERPAEPVRDEFGPLELAAARERVEAAVGQIVVGEFTAAEPSESLCSGCPAKPALCPRWTWREGKLEMAAGAADG